MNRPPSAMCPSCERFIGPADVCPYCEADADKPPMLRWLRMAALALALLGLVFLYSMSRAREIPGVRIGDITPMMNFATVRVSGNVARTPYIGKDAERVSSVSMTIADATGEIRVYLSREAAQTLVGEARVPAKGSPVDVTGTLNVSAEGVPKLRVVLAERVQAPGAPAGEGLP